jgi:hypothetical protein
MLADSRMLIEAVAACWTVEDVESTAALFASDATYAVYLPGIVPFAGVSRGRENVRKRLGIFLTEFEVLTFRPMVIRSQGARFYSHVTFLFGHPQSGMELEGTLRQQWHMSGDKIRSLEVFHDAPRVGAFFRLVKQQYRNRPPVIA